jgi:signal transduction histidine kinase
MAVRALPRLSGRELAGRGILAVGLAGYVVIVYLVVVLGGGLLIGQTGSPNVVLSVLATTVVALGFEHARRTLGRVARRLTGGARSPDEVLRHFSSRVDIGPDDSELPLRMARLLAEGTGAQWAQVWLVVSGHPQLAASWPQTEAADLTAPDGAAPATGSAPGTHALPVRHGGQTLAVLRLREGIHRPLTPVAHRLFVGLAAQAGLVLRTAALRAELSQRLAELSERAADLRSSRERVVETQDDERRRLERDIHDGAQQHLVALAVNLGLVKTLLARDSDRVGQLLTEQSAAVREAITTLTRLSRGIYPSALSERGLVAALQEMAAISTIPIDVIAGPLPTVAVGAEAALYFCALEALQNVSKHSRARRAVVRLSGRDSGIVVSIDDDGSGFDPDTVTYGTGLSSIRDRIDAVGGTLIVAARPGAGSHVEFYVPGAGASAGSGQPAPPRTVGVY